MAFHTHCSHCYFIRIVSVAGLIGVFSLGTLSFAFEVRNGITNLDYGVNNVDYNYEGVDTTNTNSSFYTGPKKDELKKTNTTTKTTQTKDTVKTEDKIAEDSSTKNLQDDENEKTYSKDQNTKSKSSHLIMSGVGVGDTCKVGDYTPIWYALNLDFPAKTEKGLEAVMKDVSYNDRRLRRVKIYDDNVDMYYLQPATFLGMSTNYLVHVKANSTTWNFVVDQGSFAGLTTNKTSKVSDIFDDLVPTYLTDENIKYYDDASIIERDSKVLEIANQVMYQIPYMPYSNSFFVCYIMPYLVYLFVIFILGLLFLYMFYKRARKFVVQHKYDFDNHHHIESDNKYSFLNNSIPQDKPSTTIREVSFGDSKIQVEENKEDTHTKTDDDNDGFTYKKTDFKGFK